jgi:hypothetical protein
MFSPSKSDVISSARALRWMVLSVVVTAGICIADGLLAPRSHEAEYLPISRWLYDFRLLFEQLIFVSSLLYVGAKFLETRSVFSVGFNTADASRMSMKGPDGDNIVWIGRKYDSDVEAETVAAAIQEKLDRTETR